jgi:hypothetical protein
MSGKGFVGDLIASNLSAAGISTVKRDGEDEAVTNNGQALELV